MVTTNFVERFVSIFTFAARCLRAALFVALISTAAVVYGQTDYYWNATGDPLFPSGGTGTWDTSSFMWSDSSAGPLDYAWQNTGGERANFGDNTGTVTLGSDITAYGINFSTANYVIAGGGFTLTLSGTSGVIDSNVAATITAPIDGTVGLTKIGSGTLTLNAANTYSGGTTVTGSTLIGDAQASGSPFSSGPVTLNSAVLDLKLLSSITTTTNVGNLTIGAANASNLGASNLVVDNTAGGTGTTTTFAAGNLVRGGSGSALVITPQQGSLGTREVVTLTNGSSLLTNGILPTWVVTTASGSNLATDFVTYGTGAVAPGDYNHDGAVNAADYVIWRKGGSPNPNSAGDYATWRTNFGATGSSGTGVSVANYTSHDLATSTSTSVVDQSTPLAAAGNLAAYALKTDQAIGLAGNTLTLGNGSGQSGLILNNNGSISGGNVTFGPTEGVVYAQGTATLGGAGDTITSNGLTITGVGATTVTINGNIVDGTAPAKLIFTGATSQSGLVLNGNNTYSGGTILGVNNSISGGVGISVGTDTAFGTGKVTNILLPGTNSPLMQATGSDRTLANAFDINGGLSFNGSQSITFTGPFNIINSSEGGSRTLNNTITATGKSITYGSAGLPSTITIGNPVANGGDGIGKNVIINGSSNTLTIINDVLQDPAAGGGAASGTVTYTGNSSGIIQLNSLNTYNGPTMLNGGSTIQFNHDYNAGDPSGPFGLGTIVANNGSNNNLEPVGGDRTIANPISMVTGFTAANSTDAGETARNLTFTGPIKANATQVRTIRSNMTGGTLTIGSASVPSTITLNDTLDTNNNPIPVDFTGNTNSIPIVVNDVIQDGAVTGAVNVHTGIITFAAQNTYSGGTNLLGGGTILPIVIDSVPDGSGIPGALTSGPFGTGQINFNNGTNQHLRPTGGDRTIGNAILLTTGMAMDNATGETYNLTFSGPVTMTNNRFISNGFSVNNTGGSMIMGDPNMPSTISLPVSGNLTLSLAALSGPIVVNDVVQDGSGFAGKVAFNPNTNDNSPITVTAQNTYTGGTQIGTNGLGNVQVAVDSIGEYGLITSGPFGTGTITPTNTSASPPSIVPFGADRTVSNDFNLTGNLGAANAGADTFNLNLTGPISLPTTGRSIVNKMAGTLTLGKSTPAASTNTIILSGTASQQLTFTGNSTSMTVVNDAIVNGGVPGNITVAGSIVQFNNDNSYGPTSPGTTTNTTVSGGKLLADNTSGSATGTGNVLVSGGILGGNGIIGQSVIVNSGAIAPGDNGAGILTVNGNVTYGTSSAAFNVEIGGTNPATPDFDQLVVGGSANLTVGGTLNVSLINGFTDPATSTDFTILSATGGVTGAFTGFVFPDANWSVSYTSNSVVLHVAGSPGSGSSIGSGAAVPEPSALVIGIFAVAAVLLTSRGGVCRRQRV